MQSEIRTACCMLWVTMTMVYFSFSCSASSSILEVEMGSRALVGSSINSTWGSTARARAMHSRCCWPPERPRAFFFSRSFTSSQMAAPRRERSTISSSRALPFTPWVRGP